jgi:CP family cyanate transporter-like MFS transporter
MLLAFTGIGWISPIATAHGVSVRAAAWALTTFQIFQVVGMVIVAPLSDVFNDRRPLLAAALLSAGSGLALLAFAPSSALAPASVLFGLGAGATTALALILIQDASSSKGEAVRIGSMAMVVGNCFGASGPLAIGAMRDLTGSFAAGFSVPLVAVLVGLALVSSAPPGRTAGGE